MTATRVTELSALRALEPEWWDLWHRSPEASPFASPAWLLPWWETFAPGPLATVAVRRDQRLVALLPLYHEEATHRLLPLGIGITDALDMLGDEAGGAEALAALDGFSGWDVLSLEELPPEAPALRWARPAGWTEEGDVQSLCPVLSWGPGADLAGAIPGSKLRKLRMARHRAERRGAVVERATAETASAHLDALIALHTARWDSRGEAGVLADPRVQAFHRAAAPRLAAAGLLEAAWLRIGDQVVGSFYGLRRGATLYAYLGGFDPAFAFESPGTVLMGHVIEAALAAGAGALNLLRGQEPYKYAWGAHDRPHRRRLLRRAALP